MMMSFPEIFLFKSQRTEVLVLVPKEFVTPGICSDCPGGSLLKAPVLGSGEHAGSCGPALHVLIAWKL